MVIILAIAVEGDQKVIHVSKLITDNSLSNGKGDNTCCVYGNCSCNSLDIALASLTSNVLINITTDVTLSSFIKVSDLQNVSVIGYNNPSVNCRSIGGVHFTFSYNLIFKDITLSGCGSRLNYHTKSGPGLNLSCSSNVMIQNCLFQHSLGPVVVLLMSKNVTISSCRFSNNKAACIYVKNQNVFFTGKNLFINNTVDNTGGIYISDHSTVVFNKSSNVTFIKNFSNFTFLKEGEVVVLKNNSTILFDQNSSVMFNKNGAFPNGIIYSNVNCTIIFAASCKVTFNDNSGSVIHSSKGSNITFMGNSIVTFCDNILQFNGTVFSDYGYICFKENSSTMFYNNADSALSLFLSDVSFEGNSYTLFCNNSAKAGGAIYNLQSNISFKEKSTSEFYHNIAMLSGKERFFFINNPYSNGGAIYSAESSHIIFKGNSSIIFHSNIADYRGGAIFTEHHSVIRFCGNSTVIFTKNKAKFGATVHSTDNSKIIAKGDFTVIVNNFQAKWCTSACIPYTGQSNDTVLIDCNGLVWCSNVEAFLCLSKKCHCMRLEDIMVTTTKELITHITDKVVLSSAISLNYLENISIIGHNKLIVLCINGKGLFLKNCRRLIVENITWVGCGDFSTSQPVLSIYESIDVTIKNCTFQHSMGVVIKVEQMKGIMNIIDCNFMSNNHYKDHGSAIQYTSYKEYPLKINNCTFSYNGAAESIVYLRMTSNFYNPYKFRIYIINSVFCNNNGASIYLSALSSNIKSNVYLHISRKVLFKNNVAKNGAGIYSERSSVVIFDKDSDVTFINNSVEQNGAAFFINSYSQIIFNLNARVKFINNKASNGTIYSKDHSMVIFTIVCKVTFSDNSVTQYGAAIYSSDNSNISFTESSNVTIKQNVVLSNSKDLQIGGSVFSVNYSHVTFEHDSFTTFINNFADFGAAILSLYASQVSFKNRSIIIFKYNKAHYCGILTSAFYSSVDFNDIAEVFYYSNTVSGILNSDDNESAGTICTFIGANIRFSGYSLTAFIDNRAVRGGAAVFSTSNVVIEEHATVIFSNNTAVYSSGGAFVCFNDSTVSFKGNVLAFFYSNEAGKSGGAIHSYNFCNITFKDNSKLTFANNTARDDGGAIVSTQHSTVIFEGNTSIIFYNNTADNGGSFYLTNSSIIFTGSSVIRFSINKARKKGGVGYSSLRSKLIFEGSTVVKFYNNLAELNAGVLYSAHSYILFKGNSSLTLAHNTVALKGGAFNLDLKSSASFSQFTNLKFYGNKATYGGAILANDHSSITVSGNSVLLFADNRAAQYGGAIFLDITTVMINNCSNKNCINFTDNFANVLGNSLYQNVLQLCENSCYRNNVADIRNKFIATPPNKLIFYHPAVCIDKDDMQCNIYYIQNIMLGTEIIIPACVFDYYNHSINSTQFMLKSEMHLNYKINGAKQILISCDAFKGISIIGNQSLTKSTNFSINIALNTVFNPSWRPISVTLIINLSPCHLGFWHSSKSPKCECYNANDIVFCSGTSSTIKRGYWFGKVNGKPTMTFCPINYCNFTCCETSNGYYHLSPVRNNQCRLHRTGTACGSCISDYSLSFDSPKCVRIEGCTAGKTVLVVLLTVLYWIIIVALVFALMYYKVGICYLYSITYYYSIVDILLTQTLQVSTGLDITINIISSFSKITPQFLGELCLTTGMSGIDQQFIHYMHPLAIVVILVIITLSARRSQRISNIIRRGIIRVICLLLLLSYTSMASTSLLLMRPLKFHDIDKVYTYLSPDIEYFHGRHLAYSIAALLCAISIVIGLPLLLILEPFLNQKINFIKIKPLLDQFQGSYKDKCRSFAGYYMICRLFIIIIVIANSSNYFITSYILITVCSVIAFVHQTIKPYANNKLLNRFDGLILQLISLIAALPLLENFDSPSVIFALITLPLLTFIVMTLFLNRFNLKKITVYFINKIESIINDDVRITDDVTSSETDLREFRTIIVDDSKRKNAIVCDM